MSEEIKTIKHIMDVQGFISIIVGELETRARFHDRSKLYSPEVETFDVYSKKLKGCTYNSEEYKQFLKGMKPALDHHYAENNHHPEHWENGIADMDLVDLTEMLCDWKAATLRHDDGDLIKSIEQNQKRFGYSNDIKKLLLKTARRLK